MATAVAFVLAKLIFFKTLFLVVTYTLGSVTCCVAILKDIIKKHLNYFFYAVQKNNREEANGWLNQTTADRDAYSDNFLVVLIMVPFCCQKNWVCVACLKQKMAIRNIFAILIPFFFYNKSLKTSIYSESGFMCR